jgi:hypothetical protein
MAEISKSGFYQDDRGQPFIVTQGLSGYTLVDKKKILFRLFLHPIFLSRVTAVAVKIKYIGTDIPDTTILIPFSDLLIENSIPNGPSVGIIFQGNVFANASIRYFVQFNVLGENGLNLATFVMSNLKFQKSGRLRILAKTVQSITRTAPWGNKIESNIFWLADLVDSMIRFGAMLPVSDGVTFGSNAPAHRGLAYWVGESIDAWPQVCPKGAPPSEPDKEFPSFLVCPKEEMREYILEEAKNWNSQPGVVKVDTTFLWRHRDITKLPTPEASGGNASYDVPRDRRFATAVGGLQNNFETTASLLAQEVGHNFGAVSRQSPYSDGGGHSTIVDILDPLAFDFVRLRPYYPSEHPVADVMGVAWGRGRDLTLYNDYDWEHLRQRLVQTSAIAPEVQDETARKKKLVEEVQTPLAELQKIQVESPESALYPKPGFQWNWTTIGFQCLKEDKENGDSSGLAPSAKKMLSALREQDIKEIYVPIDGKPLTVVINRTPRMTCNLDGMDSSGLP